MWRTLRGDLIRALRSTFRSLDLVLAVVSIGLGGRLAARSGIYRVSRGSLLDGLHTSWTALSVPLQLDVRVASSGTLSYHGYAGLSLDSKGTCSQEFRSVEGRRRDFTEDLCGSPAGSSSLQVGTLIGAGVELRGRDGVTAVGRFSYEFGLEPLYDGPAGQDLRASGWAVELGLMWTIRGDRTIASTVRQVRSASEP